MTTLDVTKSVSSLKIETSESLDLMKSQVKNLTEEINYKNKS
jgi:hypothetical protein